MTRMESLASASASRAAMTQAAVPPVGSECVDLDFDVLMFFGGGFGMVVLTSGDDYVDFLDGVWEGLV